MTHPAKRLNDPIHGLIILPGELFQVIDTPEFQRLRDIKQLGGMYFVFPGAVHNRFEHCLGTAHLAGVWLDHLLSTEPRIGLVNEREKRLVQFAGLCHDLGHGPFSHTFEKCFEISKESPWHHEKMSCRILNEINERKKIFDNSEFKTVSDMILGKVPLLAGQKKFLYQIVHNEEFEVDVDKFDYLQRDCHGARLPLGVDPDRIIKVSSLNENGDIEFPLKESYNLVQLFSTRYALHKQVYSHSVVQAVELMIGDILRERMAKEIEEYLLKDEVTKEGLKWYLGLTDGILREFERSTSPPGRLLDLRERRLYELCREFVVKNKELKSELDRISCEARVIMVKRNWCMGNSNPLLKIHFWPKPENETAIDLLLPEHYQEIRIRVFAHHGRAAEVNTAIDEFLKSHTDVMKMISSTPDHKKIKARRNETKSPPPYSLDIQ